MPSLSFGVDSVATVIWVAAMPVLELRAAIPLAVSLGFPAVEAYVLGVLGSLLPVPLLLLLLKPLATRLRRVPRFRGFVRYLYRRARAPRGILDRFGLIGLALLVAIPLPSTGAWTGAIVASLLGFRFWPSFLAIMIGTMTAGAVVTLLTLSTMSMP